MSTIIITILFALFFLATLPGVNNRDRYYQ